MNCEMGVPSATSEVLGCLLVGKSAEVAVDIKMRTEKLYLRIPPDVTHSAQKSQASHRAREITEAASIVRYLSTSSSHRERLLGADPASQGVVDSLLDFVFCTLNPALDNWASNSGEGLADAKSALEYCEELASSSQVLCKTLLNASASDMLLAASLFPFLSGRISQDQLGLPSLRKWSESLFKSDIFQEALSSLGVSSDVAIQLSHAKRTVSPLRAVRREIKGSDTSSARPATASAAAASPGLDRTGEVGQLFQDLYALLGAQSPLASTAASACPSASGSSAPDAYSSLPSSFLPCKRKQEYQEHKGPKLPRKDKRNILITSALPYVNNVPHLGNLIGCVLSADVFARFCRLRGDNAIYMCGTDEYGTATETKAMQEGLTPQQVCDKYHAIHREIYEWFNIRFDHFGRTTTKQQTEICHDIFNKNDANGWVQEATMRQPWCTSCSKFLADRYIHGTCPNCKYEDARGDQCDKCQKLLNPTELLDSWCWVCKTPNPEVRDTTHLFLNLPGLEGKLRTFVDRASVEGHWSSNSLMITQTWLKTGLKPRCITRDLKWGTPVPKPGFTDKVFYVWFDAPIGYLSITANYTKDWERWWKNPSQVKLYQFMGKDNVPFHTVIFPCSLLGTGDNYTFLHHISTTEYLNYETGKFSKSRGSGVFGDGAQGTGIPAFAWRYYLLSNRPETSDSLFVWDEFATKVNSELLNNLGNFINRALTFCSSRFKGQVPEGTSLQDIDKTFVWALWDTLQAYLAAMDKVRLRQGLSLVLELSRLGNQYQQDTKPWELLKQGEEGTKRCGTVMRVVTNVAYLLAVVADPFIPSFSQTVAEQCGLPLVEDAAPLSHLSAPLDLLTFLPPPHKLGKPSPIVQAISAEQVKQFRQQFKGTVEGNIDFPLELKAARVMEVAVHPKDEQLWVMQLDVKEEKPRQVVARLRGLYSEEELKALTLVLLCNLKAAKIKGEASQGMLLTAVSGRGKAEQRAVLVVDNDTAPGTLLLPEESTMDAKPNFDVRKELSKLHFEVNDKLEVFFSERQFKPPIKSLKVGKGAKVQ